MQKLDRQKYDGNSMKRINGTSQFHGSISLTENNQMTLTTKGVMLLKLKDSCYPFDIYEHEKSIFLHFNKKGQFVFKKKKASHNGYWVNLGKSLTNFIKANNVDLPVSDYSSARKSLCFFLKKEGNKFKITNKV